MVGTAISIVAGVLASREQAVAIPRNVVPWQLVVLTETAQSVQVFMICWHMHRSCSDGYTLKLSQCCYKLL